MVKQYRSANSAPVGESDSSRKYFKRQSFLTNNSIGNSCRMLLGIHLDNPQRIDVSDPVSDEFYDYFRGVARKNALIYEEVFLTLPSDRVRNFDHLNNYYEDGKLSETDPIRVNKNEPMRFIWK
jgi:hypothetical protein